MGRWVAALAVVVLATTTAGCSASSSGDPETSDDAAPPPGVSLSFGQLRNDEGTPRAQLRVVNGSDDDLDVTGVGLDWPGFGAFVTPYETVVAAGRTLDIRFDLPEPRCGGADDDVPVLGRLGLVGPGGDDTVAAELDTTGAGYVTRIHERWCADLAVSDAVDVVYGDEWRLVGSGRRARLVGEVGLVRRAADGPLALTSLRGSVLLETRLTRPVRLVSDHRRASSRLELRVPRCDEHAFVDSSQTFHFLAGVRLGGAPTTQVYRLPGAPTRQAAERLLDEACVVGGAID